MLAAAVAVSLAWAAPATAQTFKVLSVNTPGCTSGAFSLAVERAGLDGGAYTVHTVVTVGGQIYMNEAASISVNGPSGWNLFNNFTYGAVPNPGTWPIPQKTQVRIDFKLERPVGTVLHAWTTVVSSCNTGTIQYNGKGTDLTLRDRTLALGYASNRFIGWLYAKGAPKLHSRRLVTIWKVRPGPDLRIGRARTTTRGNFALRRDRRNGVYYAVAGALMVPGAGFAVKERSTNLRLR